MKWHLFFINLLFISAGILLSVSARADEIDDFLDHYQELSSTAQKNEFIKVRFPELEANALQDTENKILQDISYLLIQLMEKDQQYVLAEATLDNTDQELRKMIIKYVFGKTDINVKHPSLVQEYLELTPVKTLNSVLQDLFSSGIDEYRKPLYQTILNMHGSELDSNCLEKLLQTLLLPMN